MPGNGHIQFPFPAHIIVRDHALAEHSVLLEDCPILYGSGKLINEYPAKAENLR